MTVLSFIVIISLLVNLLDPVDKMGGSALEFVVFEVIINNNFQIEIVKNVIFLRCSFEQIFLILEVSEKM